MDFVLNIFLTQIRNYIKYKYSANWIIIKLKSDQDGLNVPLSLVKL